MNIDKNFLDRKAWWEDRDGNVIEVPDGGISDDVANELIECGITYHSCFPLEMTEHIYDYGWKPKTKLQKFLCKFRLLYRILEKKYRTEKTFNHMFDVNYHIGNEDVIMAMVNSGDYTLSQALMLWAHSCERCMNVLAFKYLDGKEGYPEYSKEWEECNTVCRFCEDREEEKVYPCHDCYKEDWCDSWEAKYCCKLCNYEGDGDCDSCELEDGRKG